MGKGKGRFSEAREARAESLGGSARRRGGRRRQRCERRAGGRGVGGQREGGWE